MELEKQRCEVDPDWSMGHCRPQNSVNIKYGKLAMIGVAKWNAGYKPMSGGDGRIQGGDWKGRQNRIQVTGR